MKNLFLLFAALLLSLTVISQNTPEPAFEFLSKYNNVRDLALSKNQDEVYFTIQSPNEEMAVIACVKRINKNWGEPELAGFSGKSGKYRDLEPFLTPDGLTLYFSSDRPTNDSIAKAKDYDIWYVKRNDLKSEWSKPINLGKTINSARDEFYPSLANNRNLYFTCDGPNSTGKDDIYFSKWNGENYSAPVALDTNINSEGFEFNAYVSPDENFLVYTVYASKEGLGSGDLYISFKDKTNHWCKSTNLGKGINSRRMDYCPYVDLSTNTLYFTSRRTSIETKNYNSLKDFEKIINEYENGLSRIYKVSLQNIIGK
ncbi:MAG: hypothetical protein JWN78_1214 [Bacteroidota bacterium]|nr:hypothetical protein [Bacteroidota bacterium]